MPRKAKEMPAIEVKRIETPGRHAVGGVAGLLLVVKDSGAKSWIFRTTVGDRRRNIGLGGYPDVPLASAREKARAIKDVIEQGVDPIAERQARRMALIKERMSKMIFAEAARLCHEKKIPEFKNEKHKQDWIRSIEMYVNPVIGQMAVADIELSHILQIFEPIWQKKTETATRIRQRVEQVLTWATVAGYRSGENPARWKGHLDAVLPAPTKIKKTSHFAALPYQEIERFMSRLRQSDAMSARALEFIILTACRSGEARLATWNEINFEKGVWTIPADRMKAQKDHIVPLTDDALKILKDVPRFEEVETIFASTRGGPMSDMTISKKVKDLHSADVKAGGKGFIDPRQDKIVVPHGFRSSFRDWAAESTNFPREVCEQALAHTIGSKVEAAYRRGDLFEKRRKLMDAWAGFCRQVKVNGQADILTIRGAK